MRNILCAINNWGSATPNAQIQNAAYANVGSALTSGYNLVGTSLQWTIPVADGTSGYILIYPAGSPTDAVIFTFENPCDQSCDLSVIGVG